MRLLSACTRLAGQGLVVFTVALATAQSPDIPRVLTMEDAVRIAAKRNPSIKAARNEVEMLEADMVTAGKRLNPAFTFENENYPYFSSNRGPFFSNQETTARMDYEIETRGRRRLRTETARRAVEVQESVYADRLRQLRLEVQRALYRVVLAKANLEVARSVLEHTDEVIDLNQVRFEQGAISELELKRIEVERLRFLDDVFQSELAMRNAKSTLLGLLNASDLGQDIDVAGSLPVADEAAETGLPPRAPLAELRRVAMENRPDLAAAIIEERRADSQARLQSAIRAPNITAGGGYKRNGPDNSLVFGVTVPLKIFDRNQGGILRAQAERNRAANLAAVVRSRIELDIQKAYNAVDINRQRVDYIKTRHLRKAEDASTVTLAAYRLGAVPLMDYLDAQRGYRDTVRIYNQALFDNRMSLYELASAIGMGGSK